MYTLYTLPLFTREMSSYSKAIIDMSQIMLEVSTYHTEFTKTTHKCIKITQMVGTEGIYLCYMPWVFSVHPPPLTNSNEHNEHSL